MRLGINFGYQDWGTGLASAIAAGAGGGTARLPLGLDGRGVRHRRDHAAHLARWRTPRTLNVRLRDHADAGAHAGDDRDDRGHARPDERRPLPPRARAVGPAGRRGLARPAVRQAAGEDARVRRHRARDPGARSAARAPRRALRHPVQRPRRHRARQAAQDHRAPAPRRHPDLPRGDRARRTSQLAAEIADGWLPIFFSPYRFKDAFGAALDAGFAEAGGGKSLADFDVAPTVTVIVGDDVETLRGFVKPMVALYVGGMGARGKNFYNDLACRYGFEAAAKEIQDLYLDGKKAGGRRRGARRADRRGLRCSARRSASPTASTPGARAASPR